MLKTFTFLEEKQPGEAWLARFVAGRDAAAQWYQGQGRSTAPSAAECRDAMRRHMPELITHYDRACALVGDDPLAHQILSHYRPQPLQVGCSQAVWLGPDGPALVRNYDFPLAIVSSHFELTAWSSRRVISKGQRPWGGCTDGMNDEGLVASLTDGGSAAEGLGFAAIFLLRYVLETCSRVDEAVAALTQIPIARSQNVTLLDKTGSYATLFLGPNRRAAVTSNRVCANHQEPLSLPREMMTPSMLRSLERERILQSALDEGDFALARLVALFLERPIYSYSARSPTAYTAIYRPAENRVDYIWPGKVVPQEFDTYSTGEYTHDFGELET